MHEQRHSLQTFHGCVLIRCAVMNSRRKEMMMWLQVATIAGAACS
jgi:hypothetical protein